MSKTLQVTARWLPLAVWFVAISMLMAGLAIGHWFTLPHPSKHDTRLAAGLAELLPGNSGWAAVHVVSTDCRCSQRIIDHLIESTRPSDVHEVVVLIGGGGDRAIESRVRAKGYSVVPVEPEALYERFGIESAPLFVFVDPSRDVRYLGGYTRRQQGPDIEDLAIMSDIQSGVATLDLPIFGCAVSRRLKELADPLAIKRSR